MENRLESQKISKSPEVIKERESNLSLRNYIEKNSGILARADELNDRLKKLATPNKGIMSYSDSDDVKFSVKGYDFLYFDDSGDLRHTKIIPEEAAILEKAGRTGERKDLESELKKEGFTLDDSEELRGLIWQQLNTKKE